MFHFGTLLRTAVCAIMAMRLAAAYPSGCHGEEPNSIGSPQFVIEGDIEANPYSASDVHKDSIDISVHLHLGAPGIGNELVQVCSEKPCANNKECSTDPNGHKWDKNFCTKTSPQTSVCCTKK